MLRSGVAGAVTTNTARTEFVSSILMFLFSVAVAGNIRT